MKAKLLTFLFFLTIAVPVCGQQAKPEEKGVKLALINTAYFDDEKNGIVEYVQAFKTLEAEFYAFAHISRFRQPIEALEKQLQNTSLTALERGLKEQELKTRKLEYERMKKNQDEVFERRYVAFIGPIQNQIAKEIARIGKQNNLLLIDASRDEKGLLLWADIETIDLTRQFIDYYNNRKLTNADFVLKTKIPEIRVAQINRRLLDKNNDKLERIIAEFAKEKGYVFVFDFTRTDGIITSLAAPDITKEFIAYFNERYPENR